MMTSCGYPGWLPRPKRTPAVGIVDMGFKLENSEGRSLTVCSEASGLAAL